MITSCFALFLKKQTKTRQKPSYKRHLLKWQLDNSSTPFFVRHNFSSEKNFSHQAKIFPVLSDKVLSDIITSPNQERHETFDPSSPFQSFQKKKSDFFLKFPKNLIPSYVKKEKRQKISLPKMLQSNKVHTEGTLLVQIWPKVLIFNKIVVIFLF